MKRLFDIVAGLSALIIFSPVMLILAVLIALKLGTPVLFKQPRPGYKQRVFSMLKFRSMTNERDSAGELLPDEQRLTGFGRFLRSTSLDELPGLFAIIKGDMSLVGPRPLLVDYLSLYNDEQRRRHDVKPGLTGWAQVNGRNNLDWQKRFELDIWYVDHQSFCLDLKIILLTVKAVLRRDDVSQTGYATAERFMGNEQEKSAG